VGCLVGKETNLLRSHNITKTEFFGTGKSFNEVFWNSLIRYMLVNQMIVKVTESYGIIKLCQSSHDYLKSPTDFYITENHNFEESNMLKSQPNSIQKSVFDKVLFSILISERKKISKSKGIPPYAIFQESSIEEMAIKYPESVNELKNINGVGEGKAVKFGESFVILISDYVNENDIQRPDDLIVKSTGTNSALKLFVIQSIDRKIQPIDIAKSKGIEISELIKELETIVFSGTKLNINYMIDEIFDEEQQEELYEYFIDSESDDINLAIDEFDGDYEELDLKLYRIKFINDVSN
jgi:ATP-dependent DNA helicase RecQ